MSRGGGKTSPTPKVYIKLPPPNTGRKTPPIPLQRTAIWYLPGDKRVAPDPESSGSNKKQATIMEDALKELEDERILMKEALSKVEHENGLLQKEIERLNTENEELKKTGSDQAQDIDRMYTQLDRDKGGGSLSIFSSALHGTETRVDQDASSVGLPVDHLVEDLFGGDDKKDESDKKDENLSSGAGEPLWDPTSNEFLCHRGPQVESFGDVASRSTEEGRAEHLREPTSGGQSLGHADTTLGSDVKKSGKPDETASTVQCLPACTPETPSTLSADAANVCFDKDIEFDPRQAAYFKELTSNLSPSAGEPFSVDAVPFVPKAAFTFVALPAANEARVSQNQNLVRPELLDPPHLGAAGSRFHFKSEREEETYVNPAPFQLVGVQLPLEYIASKAKPVFVVQRSLIESKQIVLMVELLAGECETQIPDSALALTGSRKPSRLHAKIFITPANPSSLSGLYGKDVAVTIFAAGLSFVSLHLEVLDNKGENAEVFSLPDVDTLSAVVDPQTPAWTLSHSRGSPPQTVRTKLLFPHRKYMDGFLFALSYVRFLDSHASCRIPLHETPSSETQVKSLPTKGFFGPDAGHP
ncbi:hypothetical protein DFH06DRAFT_1335358 [Mycena polygramma]|nr:hypothetical protein DFH06DRAFT_1335358 [Mycena polygramma]